MSSGGNSAVVFNFTTEPAGSDWVQKYIVYGDMGRHGGGMILQMVENEIAIGDTTAIIHAGLLREIIIVRILSFINVVLVMR